MPDDNITQDLGARAETALATVLRRTTRLGLYEAITRDLDGPVDPTAYPVFSAIARLGPISSAELAPHVGLERSVAGRYAARFEQAGLVMRLADPHDRRVRLLTLTTRGEQLVAELRGRLATQLESRFRTWPRGVAEGFVRGLEYFVADELDVRHDAG